MPFPGLGRRSSSTLSPKKCSYDFISLWILLLLVSWNPRQNLSSPKLHLCGVKLRDRVGILQLNCVDCTNLVYKGFGRRLQNHQLVVGSCSFFVRDHGDDKVWLCCVWRTLCHHTSIIKAYSIERTLGIHPPFHTCDYFYPLLTCCIDFAFFAYSLHILCTFFPYSPST
jgi:hypothetical protein